MGFRPLETGCASAKLLTIHPLRCIAQRASGHLMVVTCPLSSEYSKIGCSADRSACQSHISAKVSVPSRGGDVNVVVDSDCVLGAGAIGRNLRVLGLIVLGSISRAGCK